MIFPKTQQFTTMNLKSLICNLFFSKVNEGQKLNLDGFDKAFI